MSAMTTEGHAWAAAQSTTTAVRSGLVCGCGQDLDVCTGSHCSRCGTELHRPHAA